MPETEKKKSQNMSDKRLVSMIYKELLEFNKEKIGDQSLEVEKVSSKPSTWEDAQVRVSTWGNPQRHH